MILVDDAVTVEPLIFNELAADHPDLFSSDWANLAQPEEPWQWEWRTPLRALQQQLIGTSDVTGWTQQAGQELASVLQEPATMHPSLLHLREAETGVGLLPAVSGDPDADTVSAEGDEPGMLPPL